MAYSDLKSTGAPGWFQLASEPRRQALHVLTKANVLDVQPAWRDRVVRADRCSEFHQWELSHLYVDNGAADATGAGPKAISIVLASPAIPVGDILSDEAAMLTGSICICCRQRRSAQRPEFLSRCMVSAPTSRGLDRRQPLANALSAANGCCASA